ncbi:DUF5719 family protein [Agromyces mediolanus]|uniref:DUF5719 family protein n=1 Tax=Agromyces mediolanus TaxID=41986 RepID=UPI0038390833
MPDSRRLLRAGGRGIAVVGAAALTVAAFGAAALVPWPEHRVEPLARSIQPAESRTLRVCPGPMLELGDDAESVSTLGSARIQVATQPADAGAERVPLSPPRGSEDDIAVALVTEPGAVEPGLLAGAQSQRLTSETTAGFIAAACAEPVADAWLAGGSTELGRQTLLLLANPGEVAATVDVRVHSETGPVDAPAGLGLVVQPGAQRVVSIAGLAPGAASPVVHVTSTGGTVAASLEQTSIDVLTPTGADLIGTTAAPAKRQTITGLIVPQAGGIAVDEDHAEGDAHPSLRLLAPGTEPVDAAVSVVPETGGEGSVFDVVLQPGQVSDIPLGELAAGAYTVRIDADGELVAAARTATRAGREELPSDFAWFPAALPLLDETLVAVPRGPGPKLHLANTTDADIEASVTGDDGERQVTVPAGGAVSVSMPAGGQGLIAGGAGLQASVSFAGDRQLAGFAVQPPGPLDSPILVYPR